MFGRIKCMLCYKSLKEICHSYCWFSVLNAVEKHIQEAVLSSNGNTNESLYCVSLGETCITTELMSDELLLSSSALGLEYSAVQFSPGYVSCLFFPLLPYNLLCIPA